MSNRSNFSPHEDMYMSACSLNKLPWERSNFHSLGLCSLCSKFFIYTLFPLFVTSFPLLFYFTSTFFLPRLDKDEWDAFNQSYIPKHSIILCTVDCTPAPSVGRKTSGQRKASRTKRISCDYLIEVLC